MTVEFQELKVPGPIPTKMSRPFWDAAKNQEFKLMHCGSCSKWIFYPRNHCPHCWSSDVSWRKASGRGVLKSFSVIHRPGYPGWAVVIPYAVALVELEEGPTMLSTLTDLDVKELQVGMPLEVRFTPIGEYVLPMFTKSRRGQT